MTHMMNNKCWMFASSWKPCIFKTDLSKHNLIKDVATLRLLPTHGLI